jgi:hypothetical protein
MDCFVLGLRPAVENAACGVTQNRDGSNARSRNVLHAPVTAEVRPKTEVCAHEGLDRGRSHKASVAVAVVDEAAGEFLERATFLQNRAGLRCEVLLPLVLGIPTLCGQATIKRRRLKGASR